LNQQIASVIVSVCGRAPGVVLVKEILVYWFSCDIVYRDKSVVWVEEEQVLQEATFLSASGGGAGVDVIPEYSTQPKVACCGESGLSAGYAASKALPSSPWASKIFMIVVAGVAR